MNITMRLTIRPILHYQNIVVNNRKITNKGKDIWEWTSDKPNTLRQNWNWINRWDAPVGRSPRIWHEPLKSIPHTDAAPPIAICGQPRGLLLMLCANVIICSVAACLIERFVDGFTREMKWKEFTRLVISVLSLTAILGRFLHTIEQSPNRSNKIN